MIFDIKALKIYAKGLNLNPEETELFIKKHFELINEYTTSEFVKFNVENSPEKLTEIQELLNSKNKEDIEKATRIIKDQIQFLRFAYPELDDMIKRRIHEYESSMLFTFLQYGPTDVITELLEYLEAKIDKTLDYKKTFQELKKRLELKKSSKKNF